MIKDRVIQLIDYKQVGKEIFFTKIGMTSANFRGNARKTPLNSTAIENIFSIFPDVNLQWLITGEGEMLIPPEGAKKDTIYISNPDKDEIIQLQREQIQLLKEKLANFKKVSTGYVPTPPTIPTAATPDVEAASVTRIIEHSEEPSRRRP